MALLERYKLTPTELFTVKVILLATDDGDYTWVQKFAKLLKLRDILISLQEKGIILKSFKIGSEGSSLSIEDIPFNQNFKKQFFRASFEMGEELFNTYPQFIVVGGISYNARRVSKKYNDLEDAFAKYGKAIKNSPQDHKKIIELIKYGIENNYNFTTLDDFICDRGWLALDAWKNGSGLNINNEAIKMI